VSSDSLVSVLSTGDLGRAECVTTATPLSLRAIVERLSMCANVALVELGVEGTTASMYGQAGGESQVALLVKLAVSRTSSRAGV